MAAETEVLSYQFKDAGEIPNNPRLSLLVYKQAIEAGDGDLASAFEKLFLKGGWYPAWRYGVYAFPHYHSTAHEVLAVYRGNAQIRLGHTAGITLAVHPGDVLIVPAGVGHQNLGASGDFHVVGGYPERQEADLLRGKPGERPTADHNIAAVPLPSGDPIFGLTGPLLKHWRT